LGPLVKDVKLTRVISVRKSVVGDIDEGYAADDDVNAYQGTEREALSGAQTTIYHSSFAIMSRWRSWIRARYW
jgi:hypothetical protein